MSDFRWLIEAPGQRYLAVQRLNMSDNFEWTTDHNKALAFRSQEQADALMMAVRQMDRVLDGHKNHGKLSWGELFSFEPTLGNAKAVEHGWLEPAKEAATIPAGPRNDTANSEKIALSEPAKERRADAWLLSWHSANGESGLKAFVNEEDAHHSAKNLELYRSSETMTDVQPLYADTWKDAIEASAKVVEKYGLERVNQEKDYPATMAAACVHRIRELQR